MIPIPIPYGEQKICTAGATAQKAVRCESCDKKYVYLTYREGVGSGDNFLWLNSAGADAEAAEEARQNVADKLAWAVDPVPCPNCGHFQSDMILPAQRLHLYRWHRVGLWMAVAGLILTPLAYG